MNKPQKIILCAVVFIFLIPALSCAGQFKVIRVTEGDTLEAESGGYTVTVRLVGIDAPETSKEKGQAGQPFSQKSRTHLMRLVLDKVVEVDGYGLDRYSRVLGIVYVDGKNVNLEMVKEGLAEVYRGPPAKGLEMEPYRQAEAEAKKADRGMWSLGDKYVSPREWRRMNR